jgi:hypothetical protein
LPRLQSNWFVANAAIELNSSVAPIATAAPDFRFIVDLRIRRLLGSEAIKPAGGIPLGQQTDLPAGSAVGSYGVRSGADA